MLNPLTMKRAVLTSAILLIHMAAFSPAQTLPKRILINGDFDVSPVGKLPIGWKPAYPTGTVTVAKDDKDTFVRLTSADAENAGLSQEIPVPEKVTKVQVLGRMRGKPKNEKIEKRATVEVALRYKDANGALLSAAVVASGNSPNWHTFRREFELPPGCAKIEVLARSLFAVGTFDFDEVRLEFK
jgi:hypothetical protein